VQVSLAAYVNRTIRLVFYSDNNQPMWLDKIGVGGIMPGAPTLAYPLDNSYVTPLRPTLTVTNAVQAENFLLTYQFEVYSDPNLSNLVAQVPLVAAQTGTTSWTLDINLADDAQYWWRCRAFYGTNAGPWMPTAVFHVDQGDNPPSAPVPVSPLNGSSISSTNNLLVWYPGSDPDPDDYISIYNVQVGATSAFAAPLINTTVPMSALLSQEPWVTVSVPLNDLAGVTQLTPGATYYWRAQSQNEQGNVSDWSASLSFVYSVVAQPLPPTITTAQLSATNTLLLSWAGSTAPMIVQFTPSLRPPATWTNLAGPFTGTNAVVPVLTNAVGFYRLLSQ
jgi:hypothetical protein